MEEPSTKSDAPAPRYCKECGMRVGRAPIVPAQTPAPPEVFTPDEVRNLNEYQQVRRFHPFTCGSENRTDSRHADGEGLLGEPNTMISMQIGDQSTITIQTLSTGYFRAQGNGPCEWAQWPIDRFGPSESEFFPEASSKFRRELEKRLESTR